MWVKSICVIERVDEIVEYDRRINREYYGEDWGKDDEGEVEKWKVRRGRWESFIRNINTHKGLIYCEPGSGLGSESRYKGDCLRK